jgi:mRNA-degrading endonuclease RelE of RelBE toxin-antitoxin system
MKKNEIIYMPRATKQLLRLQKNDQYKIVEACETLFDFPYCQHVKALVNHPYPYRLRVGNFRVFFSYQKQILTIFVIEVRRRNERTY